jgi:hypothetical protein
MTSVKASLSIILKANDVIVAEVEDPLLWQQVLSAIQVGTSNLRKRPNGADTGDVAALDEGNRDNGASGTDAGPDPLDQLARQLGIDKTLIQGACSPTINPPYMHLDTHNWAEMRRQLPSRGKTNIAPVAVGATLLLLWSKKAGIGNITPAHARAVLATIDVDDKNPSRSVQNAKWLQSRPGQIVLNPVFIQLANKLAICFCTKDWKPWIEAATS